MRHVKQNEIHAQPPLEFIPPNLQPRLVRAFGAILPWYLQMATPLALFETHHAERLVELYRRFQAGEIRFLTAFRHPTTYDPLTCLYLISQSVPRIAKEEGVLLRYPTHTYFLYDRGIPLWAGPPVSWLLPRMGGISLQRGKLDRHGLKTAREKFLNGELPMMVAPEGGTNGLNEIVSPLEPGSAQMCFWCLDDLRNAQRTEQVYIVPLGIQYFYITPPWEGLDLALTQLETSCGLQNDPVMDRYARLTRIAEYLLGTLEQYYSRFYYQQIDVNVKDIPTRLRNLLEAGLSTAEQYFAIQPNGTVLDRCRRIEQSGWDRIYREDLKGQALSPVQRGLADRVAEEADRRMWHMRLVEGFVAVSGNYIHEKPTADRFAETLILLHSTISRLRGGDMPAFPTLGKQRVRLSVGEPILVDEMWDTYKSSRHAARQCVTELTRTLQQRLEDLVI